MIQALRENLEDFETSIDVVEPANETRSARFLSKESDNYQYNQLETLQKIDRYYLSQYESGKLDQEGQRKLFLNIVKFAADVSAKQTDVDVKDFIFIPDTSQDVDRVWFVKRLFTTWTRDNGYGKLINELNRDYSKYGTCVVKKVGKDLERINLKNLLNTQDAETLQEAVDGGGYVIQKHTLTPHQMRQFPDWDVPDLKDKQYTVYERHALVPAEKFGKEGKTLARAFYILEDDGHLLFIEEEDKLPYEEAHWDKQDGRWLGIGEVENQFENQVARNLTQNLQHRNLMWASKKLFQSADTDMVGKNLVKEVADGEILEVGPSGNIAQVNTQTQHSVDFNQASQVWDENSRQKSFMFEVSTGEQMKAGTPFRLGVILSNAAQTHFNLKKENFAFFLERSFFNQLLPIFEKQVQSKEHTLSVAANEEGVERLQKAMLTVKANQRLKDKILDENLVRNLQTLSFDFNEEFETAKRDIQDEPYFFLKAGKDALKDLHFHMELSITGEEIDIPQQIETLANLLQVIPPEDERRERILNRIISLTGMDTGSILKKIENKDNLQALQNVSAANGAGAQGLQGTFQQQPGENAEAVPQTTT